MHSPYLKCILNDKMKIFFRLRYFWYNNFDPDRNKLRENFITKEMQENARFYPVWMSSSMAKNEISFQEYHGK